MSDPLDVYVDGHPVGILIEEAGRYVFTYLPDVDPSRFVSLLMPVRAQSYVWPRLHPFFQQNLPEGIKKDTIVRRFGPHAIVSDIGLLALTGANMIGRVQVVPKGATLATAASKADMAHLLATADSQSHLLRLLDDGVAEGVSGVMPKALAYSARATVPTDDYILKTGFGDLAGLAINEFLCLEVARHAGLDVPPAQLSNDGQVLAIQRFDRLADTSKTAVEDFCALKGLDPARKYEGSLETIYRLMADYVPRDALKDNARRLFTLILVNYAVHNADAHLKNFALVYTNQGDVRLAPVYDILSGTVYPEFATGNPALTLGGKKIWSAGAMLALYASSRLSLGNTDIREAIERVSAAVHQVTPMVPAYAEHYPAFREVGKRMLDAWARGLEDIQRNAKPGKTTPAPLREQMGMSDVERAAARKEANPYANPDGAFSHKAR